MITWVVLLCLLLLACGNGMSNGPSVGWVRMLAALVWIMMIIRSTAGVCRLLLLATTQRGNHVGVGIELTSFILILSSGGIERKMVMTALLRRRRRLDWML